MVHERLLLAPEFYAAALDDSPYFQFYDRSPVTRILRDVLPRYLPQGAAVLDLGCGNAIGACHLAASGGQGLTYLGIDPDAAVCEWARKVLASLPRERVRGHVLAQTLEQYLTSTPPPVNLILSSWSFRCCVDVRREETHERLTSAIADLLLPGGVLVVGDGFIAPGATDEEIGRIRGYHDRLVGERGTGNPVFPPDQIEALFTRAGLSQVERHDVLAVPLARFLGMPHDRFGLQVFRRGAGTG
jgi:SAM-dependent methyltransferase